MIQPRIIDSDEAEQIRAFQRNPENPGWLAGRRLLHPGEPQADDLDVIAALLVVADRATHQSGDARELLARARRPNGLAIRAGRFRAVDHHSEADTPDLRLLADQCADCAPDFV